MIALFFGQRGVYDRRRKMVALGSRKTRKWISKDASPEPLDAETSPLLAKRL
jgi:hypothetical protein